jgi:putative tryptophan/tyrosine transport system substrate-binding protein
MVQADSMFFRERKQIALWGLKRKIPTLVFNSTMVEDGGLMAYAASRQAMFRRLATYVDRILKGANPGELPVELPTTFELDINLRTAKAIGLTISPAILNLADKVIE